MIESSRSIKKIVSFNQIDPASIDYLNRLVRNLLSKSAEAMICYAFIALAMNVKRNNIRTLFPLCGPCQNI